MAFLMPMVKPQYSVISPSNSLPGSRRSSQVSAPPARCGMQHHFQSHHLHNHHLQNHHLQSACRCGVDNCKHSNLHGSQRRRSAITAPISIPKCHPRMRTISSPISINVRRPSSSLSCSPKRTEDVLDLSSQMDAVNISDPDIALSSSAQSESRRTVLVFKRNTENDQCLRIDGELRPKKSILVRSSAHDCGSAASSLSGSPHVGNSFPKTMDAGSPQVPTPSSLSSSPTNSDIEERLGKLPDDSPVGGYSCSSSRGSVSPRPRSVSYNKVVEVFDTDDNRKFHTVLVDKLSREVSREDDLAPCSDGCCEVCSKQQCICQNNQNAVSAAKPSGSSNSSSSQRQQS